MGYSWLNVFDDPYAPGASSHPSGELAYQPLGPWLLRRA
jgi:hypothetical protein